MPDYTFQSPGGNAADALREFLLEEEKRKRQAMLDEITQKTASRNDEIARANLQSQNDQRDFTRANTIVENSVPGDEYNPDTAALLEKVGLGGTTRQVSMPGMIQQDAETADTRDPNRDATVSRGGSKYIGARVAADERADASKAAADARKETTHMTLDAKAEQARQHDEVVKALGEMRFDASKLSAQTLNELRNAQIDKLHTEQTTKDEALTHQKKSTEAARADLRSVITGIMTDPHLGEVIGPLAGRLPSYKPTSVDLDARIQRLRNMLSLDNAGKLKGQGAVSDAERAMLASAVTSLDQKTNPEIVTKELQRILDYDWDVGGQAPASKYKVHVSGGNAPAPPTPTPVPPSPFKVTVRSK